MEDSTPQQVKAELSNLRELDWSNFQSTAALATVSMACPQLGEHARSCQNINDVIDKLRKLSGFATFQEAIFLREVVRASMARQRLSITRAAELELSASLIEYLRDAPESQGSLFTQLKHELKIGRIDVANSIRVLLTECLLAGGALSMKNVPGATEAEIRTVFASVESTYLRLQQQQDQQFSQEVIRGSHPVLG
jgi:hypothetical protein